MNNDHKTIPEMLLKLPDGHAMQVPEDAPPQPLKYSPAAHEKVLHAVQA